MAPSSHEKLKPEGRHSMEPPNTDSTSRASIRWRILRQALLPRTSSRNQDDEFQSGLHRISRTSFNGFNLIPRELLPDDSSATNLRFRYTLPIHGSPKLLITQRISAHGSLNDFKLCNRYNIDNTGIVCQWPSEEVLAYYCLSHASLFRSKRVIELGAGYGLAGLVIGAATEASEVVITDGNPQVVDYIQKNIDANYERFGCTEVKSIALHWNQLEDSNISNSFDIIVASDCTFFKEFHRDLAQVIGLLLAPRSSEAIFFSPRRGDSLDKFLKELELCSLHFTVTEKYDTEIWNQHRVLMKGDGSWPDYEKDHCYPLLIRITR